MNVADTDQLKAQAQEDLAVLMELTLNMAEANQAGDTEVAEANAEVYLAFMHLADRTDLMLVLDKAVRVLAGEVAMDLGMDHLLEKPGVSLDEMPPLD